MIVRGSFSITNVYQTFERVRWDWPGLTRRWLISTLKQSPESR